MHVNKAKNHLSFKKMTTLISKSFGGQSFGENTLMKKLSDIFRYISDKILIFLLIINSQSESKKKMKSK